MNFSSVTVEVCQPNATIRALMQEVFEEVGAEVRPCEEGERTDLLIFDVDGERDEALGERLERYRAEGAHVLLCGLRHLREDYADAREAWIDRPFSASALLYQAAMILGVDFEPPGPFIEDTRTVETREEPIRDFGRLNGPPTREIEVDEASLLEEEFGLEPGILGGGRPEIQIDATAALDIRDLEEAHDLMVDVDDADTSGIISGGRLFSALESSPVGAEDLQRAPAPPGGLEDEGPPMFSRPTSGFQTYPDMPAPTVAARIDADEASSGQATIPSSASFMLPALDEETSLELRSFARMLADAWGRVALSARVEDRFDRINRVLHALFERGLDGAGEELGRIPQTEGFSGSLRALSLVGLFRTIRDRKLHGRLEVSTVEQAYVLYLDGGRLADIDALAGDSEQMLLHILREHGALDDATFHDLLSSYETPDHLSAPIEMRLRMEGIVSDAALNQARRLRAREIFRQACRARSGNFAFIEIYRGDAHAWPVHDLGLSVDALLLELLRDEAFETGVSVATSRTRLQADTQHLGALERAALTREERELLRFFQDGATLELARQQMAHLGPKIELIVDRLKRAELLRRVDRGVDALRPSGEFDAARPRRPTPATMVSPIGGPDERTVITDIDARELDARSEGEDDELMLMGEGPPTLERHPLIGEEDEDEIPTRSMKGHHVAPPPVEHDGTEEELDRLIEELATSFDDEDG